MDLLRKKIKNIFLSGAIPPAFIAEQIALHAAKTTIGGHSIFLGQIRSDLQGDRYVTAIEYTAYEELVLEKTQEIKKDIFNKYTLECLHIYHSIGLVKSGEICLFVFCSASHRKPAIQACNEVVERIKSELAIWGREILDDNNYQWKENS